MVRQEIGSLLSEKGGCYWKVTVIANTISSTSSLDDTASQSSSKISCTGYNNAVSAMSNFVPHNSFEAEIRQLL